MFIFHDDDDDDDFDFCNNKLFSYFVLMSIPLPQIWAWLHELIEGSVSEAVGLGVHPTVHCTVCSECDARIFFCNWFISIPINLSISNAVTVGLNLA